MLIRTMDNAYPVMRCHKRNILSSNEDEVVK